MDFLDGFGQELKIGDVVIAYIASVGTDFYVIQEFEKSEIMFFDESVVTTYAYVHNEHKGRHPIVTNECTKITTELIHKHLIFKLSYKNTEK